jgi:LysM repeat protein/lipoprotein-anchoring transpeptidase ErfK/SrfK
MNRFGWVLCAIVAAGVCGACARASAGNFSGVESGLEEAVKWKWDVDKPGPGFVWGGPVARGTGPDTGLVPAEPAATPDPAVDNTYVVKKGDALIKIARRYGVSVEHLKLANDLTGNLIRVGDVLRIPTAEEIALMPVPEPAGAQRTEDGPQAGPRLPRGVDPEVLLFQIFLDRKGFSPGPVDGKMSLRFQSLVFLYQSVNGLDLGAFRAEAARGAGNLLASYTLRPEDFAFIRRSPSGRGTKRTGVMTYGEMLREPLLGYASAWEFVAERFHCDERFLRALNPSVKMHPVAGTHFVVPNVLPFEIESALERPLQPRPDPEAPVEATIVDLSRLEIFRDGTLVAAFPVSVARPALRGRGTWRILDAVAAPRLSTVREPRVPPKTYSLPGEGGPAETRTPLLASPEYLPPGPRNPAGILWIHLAREGEDDPLPYGLHGTSAPDQMFSKESIGGFRLSNWDIARAVRLLPPGTPLNWRKGPAAPVRPPAAPPAEAPTPAATGGPNISMSKNP